jgi:hypothetical protein
LAVRHREAFDAPRYNAYPGLELPLPASMVDRFCEVLSLHARRHLGARRVLDAHGRLSLVTLPPEQLSPLQRLCHRDRLFVSPQRCALAAVVYLFHDERLGGTSFFNPRQGAAETDELMQQWARMDRTRFEQATGVGPAYLTRDSPHFRLAAVVPPRWNRMICYDGSRFHNRHIEHPELLSSDPAAGRLTINVFFQCSRAAS